MQTSNLNDSTLHEIGDLGREINDFFTRKTEGGDVRPRTTLNTDENLIFDFPPEANNLNKN